MLLLKLVLPLVLVSANGTAETVKDIKEKIRKLEAQIEAGADPALVDPYLKKFKTQLAEMEPGTKVTAPVAKKPKAKEPVATKPVAKPVPKAKVAATPKAKTKKRARGRKLNKRERELEFLKTTSVEDRLERYKELAGLISGAQGRLHSLRNSGKGWQEIKKDVRVVQDQLVVDQREMDILTESLGPLRALAGVPVFDPAMNRGAASEVAAGPTSEVPMAAAKASSLDGLKFSGHMQFRHENQNATGYAYSGGVTNTPAAKEGLSLFRLRTDLRYKTNNRIEVGFSPQAVKQLGGDEFVTSSATANTQKETSGSTVNPQVDFYEAFVNYRFTDNFSMKLGRQAMAYGDHLIIGSLPWANDARSFDALKFSYAHGKGKTDLFVSQISNDGTNADATDDSSFYGLYTQLGEMAFFKEFDIYALQKNDDGADSEINTGGLRFKIKQGSFLWKLESGVQGGLLAGNRIEDGYQVDTDLGYVSKAFDFKLGYSQAGTQYIQLYPTAHKFLGFADIFGRRNIVSYRAITSFKSNFGLSAHLWYHQFMRKDTNVVPYTLTLGTYSNNGNSDEADLGSEVNLVIKQKFLKTSQVHLGAAWFTPGEFFKDQPEDDADEARQFLYLQIITKF